MTFPEQAIGPGGTELKKARGEEAQDNGPYRRKDTKPNHVFQKMGNGTSSWSEYLCADTTKLASRRVEGEGKGWIGSFPYRRERNAKHLAQDTAREEGSRGVKITTSNLVAGDKGKVGATGKARIKVTPEKRFPRDRRGELAHLPGYRFSIWFFGGGTYKRRTWECKSHLDSSRRRITSPVVRAQAGGRNVLPPCGDHPRERGSSPKRDTYIDDALDSRR